MPALPDVQLALTGTEGQDLKQIDQVARDRLRQGERNPFAEAVAIGVDDPHCRDWNIPEFLKDQRSDILRIIDGYRTHPAQPSRAIPIIGNAGTGKTHLLATLKRELDIGETEEGLQRLARLKEGMGSSGHLLIVAEQPPENQEPLSYLLAQMVEQLIAAKGPGPQMLRALSQHVAARLLGDFLRRLDPARRLALVEGTGYWEKLGRRMGWTSAVEPPLKQLDQLIKTCEGASLSDLAGECRQRGLQPERACQLIDEHLQNSEGDDKEGCLRRNLFRGLTRSALLGDRDVLRQLLARIAPKIGEKADSEIPPAGQDQERANSTRAALKVLLEVLSVLKVPVVLAFDQLEDVLFTGSSQREKELTLGFCYGLVRLINTIPGVCVLLFVESAVWNHLTSNLPDYLRDRLRQPLPLPDQKNRKEIDLRTPVTREHILRVIRKRLAPLLNDVPSWQSLPPAFPFTDATVEKVLEAQTLRECLQMLAAQYPKVLFVDLEELRKRLARRWSQQKQSFLKLFKDSSSTEIVGRVHEALDVWLRYVREQGLKGTAGWRESVLLRDGTSPYGWLNVVRLEGPDPSGLGLGVWLGVRQGKRPDLQARLAFFEHATARLRTIVLLHRDGSDGITGASVAVYENARASGLDVRVDQLREDDFAMLVSFQSWLEVIPQDLAMFDPEQVRPVLHQLIDQQTGWLLQAIERWSEAPPETQP